MWQLHDGAGSLTHTHIHTHTHTDLVRKNGIISNNTSEREGPDCETVPVVTDGDNRKQSFISAVADFVK